MRIQHNIMAMNAYRNYNNNTSAVSRNLEKLSSGYKINRAGDDAAGLAISEKMRAQITGLNAAQKNVKDGISLVKTAEGAMQEIQDMLNRMDYLATQSANGTYDSEVDRKNLQKEVIALKDEINRIADSANFNGIKLLNGELDATEAVSKDFTSTTEAVTSGMETSLLPPKGTTLGGNTVLHQEANNGTEGTTFSVDLHNTVFANNAASGADPASKMTLTVGDKSWTLDGVGGDALKGQELVNAIVTKINESATADGTVELFNGQMFKVEAGTSGDNRITFTQVSAPSGADSEVDGDMKVEITGDIGSGTATAGAPAKKATYTIDLSNATGGDTAAGATFRDAAAVTAAGGAGNESTIDGVAVVFEGNIDKTMQKFVEDYNALDNTGANNKDYVASWDGKVLTMTAKQAGALGSTGAPTADPAMANVGNLTQNQEAVKAEYELDLSTLSDTDGQAALAAKTVDGVAIDWDNAGVDATMKAFVEKYNKETSKDYTASWADGKLTMTAKTAGAIGGTGPAAPGAPTIAFTAATKDVKTFTITNVTNVADGDTLTINGTDYTVGATGDITEADAQDGNKLAAFIASKLSSNDYDITVENNVITYTAKNAGAGAPAANVAVTSSGTAPTVTSANPTVGTDASNTAANFTNTVPGVDAGVTAGAAAAFEKAQEGVDAGPDGGNVVIGTADYNFKTTAITNVTAESGQRLASTYFDLTEDMVSDKGSIQIGKQEYTFSTDAADKGVEGKVYIGDLVDAEGNVDIAGNLDEIAQRVTDAAKDNTTWTVGHDKGGATLSFVEKQDQQEYLENGKSSLTSVENIAATFGWTTAGTSETKTVETTAGGKGNALTLQIGDTSESFNQMKVSIGDMHTEAMIYTDEETGEQSSIEDIDIGTQAGAQKAVDVIKNAINYVSSVRGDLGAIQNRLEHTANNLSVMAENIQDAESTIRDTDIAEEMMAYTKNNILVQSAQAMLAQANQVPQGVLQLLG